MNKGQIKMMETISALVIFIILLGFGLIFYSRYSENVAQNQFQEQLAERAVKITTDIFYLPEFYCSQANGEIIDNCLDKLKLSSFQEEIVNSDPQFYFSILGFSNITVHPLNSGDEEETISVYENVPVNSDGNPTWRNKESTFFNVALGDVSSHDQYYEFAYLQVEVFS